MKVILSGGGTGGHIYPAIAIANIIKQNNPQAEILFIGTENGLENEIVPKANYDIRTITVSYLKRKISFHNIKSFGMLMKGLWQARRIIKEFSPDIVIGTGGFVCGPVVYIASKLGINTVIHEQNAFPGLTNRILSKSVDCVLISFEESIPYFKGAKKLSITGNPIRQDFLTIDEYEAKRKYRKKENMPIVLVVGGSGGATKINNAIIELLEQYENKFHIILATGKRHYDEVKKKIDDLGKSAYNIQVFPYIMDMPYALKAVDLVIASAGAISIAEFTAMGKPSILIPKAYTAENHQEFNAKALEQKGASIMIKEQDLSGKILLEKINTIIENPNKQRIMSVASKNAAKIDALEHIYQEIMTLLKN